MMILFLLFPFLQAHILVVEEKPAFIQNTQISECMAQEDPVRCMASLQGVLSVDYRTSSHFSSLKIKARQPVAYWGAGLVDQSGHWFQVPQLNENQSLPSLDVQEADLYDAIALLGRFTSRHWSVKYIEKAAGGQWQVGLQDGPLLYLGSSPSSKMASLEQFFHEHPQALQSTKSYFDFRNPAMVTRGQQ